MHGLDDIAPLAEPPRSVPHWPPCKLRTDFKTSIHCIAQDRPIETRESFCRDLLLKLAGGLDLRFRTELAGDEVGCPRLRPTPTSRSSSRVSRSVRGKSAEASPAAKNM